MTRKVAPPRPQDLLLLPAEVAQLFRVDPKTVVRWVAGGKIGSVKTLGGHHRFYEEEVRKLILASSTGGLVQRRIDALDALIAAKNAAVQAPAP